MKFLVLVLLESSMSAVGGGLKQKRYTLCQTLIELILFLV